MKLAPLATLLCVLPLAGCYVVQYPGGALTLSPTPVAPQAMRAAPGAPGAAEVSIAPVPTPSVSTAPVKSSLAPPPVGTVAPQRYPNDNPVPPDYRPPAQQTPRAPVYPNGSPVPPDYVPPASRAPSGSVAYARDPGYVPYPAYPAYPTYQTYPAYPAYSAYPAYAVYPAYATYPAYAPFYPAFGASPWVSNVSVSFSWGHGWGGWGGRCCHRWR